MGRIFSYFKLLFISCKKTMKNILQIKDVNFNYGSVKALNGLNMTVPKGSVCAFVGSNGAGKTTTFSVIAGFLPFKTGEIRIMDDTLSNFRKKGGMIGLLPQDVSFFEDVPIKSQLIFLSKLSGSNNKEAIKEVEEVIDMAELSEQSNHYPSMLSRGMKVRLGIAQAVLGKPPLILLDEPTAGLDPVRKKDFYKLIEKLKRETTFIISSHQLDEIEKICDHVCMIDKGTLLRNSSMNELLSEGKTLTYILESPLMIFEDLKNYFSEFSFSLLNENKTLQLIAKDNKLSVGEINKNILTYLIKQGINILEIKQKSSLDEKYFQELKV